MSYGRGEPNSIAVKWIVLIVVSAIAVLSGAIGGCVYLFNSSNPSTEGGYIGYVYQGAFVGKGQFLGLQTGPTTFGRTWMADVINVSITPYTYDEPFDTNSQVMSKDSVPVIFSSHITLKIRANKVKEFVEKYSTLGKEKDPNKIVKNAYDQFLKEQHRTLVRTEIQNFEALAIKDNITETGKKVKSDLVEWMNKQDPDCPFEIMAIAVGNIQFPAEVANAVAKKMASVQLLEQKNTEVAIAKKEAEKRVAEAEGIAKAMEIVQTKLTPLYLQHEAIEAQKLMVGSPSHTTIYIPSGANGVPLVGTLDNTPRP